MSGHSRKSEHIYSPNG